MKKLLTLLLMMVAVFGLASCGGDDEEEQRMTFKQYLAQNDAMTVEEFDKEFTPEESVKIPADLPSQVSVYNTQVSITGDYKDEQRADHSAYMYLWQDAKKLYIYGDAEGDIINYYVDLNEVEVLYDQATAEANKYVGKKPSELANEAIDLLEEELDIDGMNLSLEKILATLDFEYEDFTEINESKYQLNQSAISKKVSSLYGGLITPEQFDQLIAKAQLTLNVYALFDGKHVSGLEVELGSPTMDVEGKVVIKIGFGYTEDKLTSFTLDANVAGVSSILFELKYANETVSVYYKLSNTYATTTEEYNVVQEETITYGKDKIEVVAKVNGVEITYISLTISNQKLNDIYALAINGEFRSSTINGMQNGLPEIQSTMSIIVKSGTTVVIPDTVKALQSQAVNVFEADNNQQDVEIIK